MTKKEPISQRDVEEYNSLFNDNQIKLDQVLADNSEKFTSLKFDWPFKESISMHIFRTEMSLINSKEIFLNGTKVDDLWKIKNYLLYHFPSLKIKEQTTKGIILIDNNDTYEVRF